MWKPPNTAPEHRYIYEKLPFIPHRKEYGDKPMVWETDIIINFDTPEAEKHCVYDEIFTKKTDEFLVYGIIYKPIINDFDDFGKWLIELYKIEDGKIVAKYSTRYNTRESQAIKFVRRIKITEASKMIDEFRFPGS